jgi:hypothetical protein
MLGELKYRVQLCVQKRIKINGGKRLNTENYTPRKCVSIEIQKKGKKAQKKATKKIMKNIKKIDETTEKVKNTLNQSAKAYKIKKPQPTSLPRLV